MTTDYLEKQQWEPTPRTQDGLLIKQLMAIQIKHMCQTPVLLQSLIETAMLRYGGWFG